MSKRKLKTCTCTFEHLLGLGFLPQNIASHHKLCKTNFNSLGDWKNAKSLRRAQLNLADSQPLAQLGGGK